MIERLSRVEVNPPFCLSTTLNNLSRANHSGTCASVIKQYNWLSADINAVSILYRGETEVKFKCLNWCIRMALTCAHVDLHAAIRPIVNNKM